MKKSTISKYLYSIIGIVLLITIWQLLAIFIGQRVFIFPGPIETFKYAIDLLTRSYIYDCIARSFINMLKGFGFSFIIAFVLGIMAGNIKKIKYMISPFMTLFKSIPTASLVYLFLLVAGINDAPVYIVCLVSMPILYEAITAGIENIDESIIDAMKLDGTKPLKANMKVKIPLAWPYIVVGIDSSLALSFKIEIMAEVITGSSKLGLGSAIVASQRTDPTNMVPIFAYSLIAVLIMYLLDMVLSITKDKAKKNIV